MLQPELQRMRAGDVGDARARPETAVGAVPVVDVPGDTAESARNMTPVVVSNAEMTSKPMPGWRR